MVIFDVWGGEGCCEHVARDVLTIEEALARSTVELQKGFLVNLRLDMAWGSYESFDTRTGQVGVTH